MSNLRKKLLQFLLEEENEDDEDVGGDSEKHETKKGVEQIPEPPEPEKEEKIITKSLLFDKINKFF